MNEYEICANEYFGASAWAPRDNMRHPIKTVAIRKPFDIAFSFEAEPRILTGSNTLENFHQR
jgi:hypothetical protein